MRDTDLYRQLLGLESPWTVERVGLDMKGQLTRSSVKSSCQSALR